MIGDLYRVILATSEPGRGSGYDTHRLIAPSYQQHMHMDDERADQKLSKKIDEVVFTSTRIERERRCVAQQDHTH